MLIQQPCRSVTELDRSFVDLQLLKLVLMISFDTLVMALFVWLITDAITDGTTSGEVVQLSRRGKPMCRGSPHPHPHTYPHELGQSRYHVPTLEDDDPRL